MGESRAYWALGNAHRHLGNLERAAFYTRRHLEISREVGDLDGINSAEETLLQLETASEAPSSPCHSLLRRRRSMEQLDMTIGQSETSSDSGQSKRRNPFSTFFNRKNNQSKTRNLNKENEEDMFDILTRVQGSRLDDQRANQKRVQTRKEDIDNLLNQIAGISGSNRRMDKQRVSLAEINRTTTDQSQSENKTVNQSQSDSNLQKLKSSKKSSKPKKSKKIEKLPDDDFFDSLITCSNRIDEQRSQITPGDQKTKVGPQLRTIPDDDFFKKLLAN